MIYPIRQYGDPSLREQASQIEPITAEHRTLAADMIETMREAKGVGLAAQQIGLAQAICVVELPAECDIDDQGERDHPTIDMPLVLINPRITHFSPARDQYEEGCLSFPEITGDIERPSEITLEHLDLDGHAHTRDVHGFLARVIQHEVDHLNGVLFIDRMSALTKQLLQTKLKKLSRQTKKAMG